MNAVVGLQATVDANNHITRLGVTCALCHSTVDNSANSKGGVRLITRQEARDRSALASDVQIARVDDLVEAVGDETCCCHAEKPPAQPSRLCGEDAQ
jgi:hypothetical protein